MIFDDWGKALIYLGIFLIIVGVIVHFGGKFIDLGKLPGDFKWQSGNTTFYFPLTTCIIISIVLSLLSYFFR